MPTAAAFIAIAASDLGYQESPAGSNRTKFAATAGHANGQPWCATFLVSVARRQGLVLPSESAYTPAMANGFKAAKQLHSIPAVGDFAFFDFPNDSKSRIQHVGVVESFTGETVTCIEGNTSAGIRGSQDNGGGVYRRRRPRAHVVGYGRPSYGPAQAPPSGGVILDDMQLIPLEVAVPHDSAGNGNVQTPAGVTLDRIVGHLVSGVRPNVDGLYVAPRAAFAPEGDHVVVSVVGGPPLGRTLVWLRIVG